MKVLIAAFGLAVLSAAPLSAACRLGLVLALDVSGSVDAVEYRLQLDGIAQALQDPQVKAAILSDPARAVSITIFEWSARQYQRQILPWRPLKTADDIDGVSAHLRGWQRVAAPEATGLGAALRQGAQALREGPVCDRQVIDVSADGRNNDWPNPEHVAREGTLSGMTVNALVILAPDMPAGDADSLIRYFEARVLHGPGAFYEVANGYGDYAAAMERKLLRETSAPRIGQGRGCVGPNAKGAGAPAKPSSCTERAGREPALVDVADLIAPEAFELLQ